MDSAPKPGLLSAATLIQDWKRIAPDHITCVESKSSRSESSICILAQCPVELIGQVQGQVAYLWNGTKRFELGQFDIDGKAIGTLPAGMQITLSDFATGNVKLEAPGSSSDT